VHHSEVHAELLRWMLHSRDYHVHCDGNDCHGDYDEAWKYKPFSTVIIQVSSDSVQAGLCPLIGQKRKGRVFFSQTII
jgi:hypothetical protein